MTVRVQRPEITENYQLRIVVCEPRWLEDAINGFLTALLVLGPIALVTPAPYPLW